MQKGMFVRKQGRPNMLGLYVALRLGKHVLRGLS